jgi:hypothetical protein
LSGLLLLAILFQPLLRYRLPTRLLAEFESLWTAASLVCGLALIRYFHLTPRWVPGSISPAQLAALCILASTLFVVVRGGTYIVRGILGKSGTLPSGKQFDDFPERLPISSPLPPALEASGSVTSITIAASVHESPQTTVDTKEYNRGRLIGDLERILLTIVVAAGSYAALAFLVAAKGVVRSDEFDKDRDFAEYFLIGSLSSVLVALFAVTITLSADGVATKICISCAGRLLQKKTKAGYPGRIFRIPACVFLQLVSERANCPVEIRSRLSGSPEPVARVSCSGSGSESCWRQRR